MTGMLPLFIAMLLSMCTATIRTDSTKAKHPAKSSRKAAQSRAATKSRHPSSTPQPERSSDGTYVDAQWVENYKRLEQTHGNYNIRADDQITTTPDGRVRVPPEVMNHFQDLLKTQLPDKTPAP